jgi:hypothetical protein
MELAFIGLVLLLIPGPLLLAATLVARGPSPTGAELAFVSGGYVVAMAAIFSVYRRAARTCWVVDFFDDRIEVRTYRTSPALHFFLWKEIVAFDDGALETVRVVTSRLVPRKIFVPTPDEASRVALLALLDKRGVKRIEGRES